MLLLSQDEVSQSNSVVSYYRSHPYSKQRLKQLKKYKSKFSLSYKDNDAININNHKITLDYIKNKIKAYESNPIDILNSEKTTI